MDWRDFMKDNDNKKKFNQISYQNQYNKTKYDRIVLMVKKGKKDELKERAKKQGISLNSYLLQIIDNYED